MLHQFITDQNTQSNDRHVKSHCNPFQYSAQNYMLTWNFIILNIAWNKGSSAGAWEFFPRMCHVIIVIVIPGFDVIEPDGTPLQYWGSILSLWLFISLPILAYILMLQRLQGHGVFCWTDMTWQRRYLMLKPCLMEHSYLCLHRGRLLIQAAQEMVLSYSRTGIRMFFFFPGDSLPCTP